jgi:outer membrane protein OmpA-like peptidoglycan-associated protein
MSPSIPLLTIVVLLLSFSSHSQENKKKRIPIAVSHLSSENKAMTKRPGNSPHNFVSMVICFKKKCRSYIGWRTRQRKMRFKGYKDGGTPPTRHQQKVLIAQDTVLAKTSPLSVPETPKDTVVPIVLKQLFILDEVLFELNSAKLNHQFTYKLDSLANILEENKHLKVNITGHTDNTGDEKHNLKLSLDRAGAVAGYLIAQKISFSRVTYEGRGSSMPIFSNDTPEGRKRNRRVEILIVGD